MIPMRTILPLIALCTCILHPACKPGAQSNADPDPATEVEISEWSVTFKKENSVSSLLDWKFHLVNKSPIQASGQLWLFGIDADGFQCWKTLAGVITTIPGSNELKRIDELSLEKAEYARIAKWRIEWRGLRQ